MKWYTCCNEEGLRRGGEWILAAVESCLENTSLVPHLLYSGPPNALTEYLARRGVKVIQHTLSFQQQLEKAPTRDGFDPTWAEGTFLRFDIPLVETKDDVILYTDTDVVFRKNPEIPDFDGVLAAANEYVINEPSLRETDEAFNAGVMAFHVPTMRQLHPIMVSFTVKNEFENGALGWYDQGVLNMLFREHCLPLPQRLNWRPFAPLEHPPDIIHFHLIKPNQVAALERGEDPDPPLPEAYLALYRRSRDSYRRALLAYAGFLREDGLEALRAAFPKSPRIQV